MRDFRDQVRRHCPSLESSSPLVEELAQDLEQRYHAALATGCSEVEAWRIANEHMAWPDLSAALPAPKKADIRPVSDFRRDFVHGIRLLRRSPAFAAASILILGAAIGVGTAIFSVFDSLIMHPLPYRNPEQLVKITESIKKFNLVKIPVATVELYDLRKMTQSYSALAGMATGEFTLTGDGGAEALRGVRVSAAIFPILGVEPLLGQAFTEADEAYGAHQVAVISEALWRRRFGADPAIVGKSIEINRQRYRVAGVSKAILNHLGRTWDLWVPLSFSPAEKGPGSRGAKSIDIIGRLNAGVTLAQANQELTGFTARLISTYPDDYPHYGMSFEAEDLTSTVAGDLRQPLTFLLSAVGILMLVACANLASLLIARGSVRRKEVTVRAALGASRGRLLRQLLAENLVIAVAACALGLGIAIVLTRLFESQGPIELVRAVGIPLNGWGLLFAMASALAATIGFGVLPAFTASSRLEQSLRQEARGTTVGRQWLRDGLVAAEVAASVTLLVAAGLLVSSFLRLEQVSTGFVAKNVATFELILPLGHYKEPAQRVAAFQAMQTGLQSLPGVVAVGAASSVPFTGRRPGSSLRVVGRPVVPNQPQPMLRAVPDADQVGACLASALQGLPQSPMKSAKSAVRFAPHIVTA